MRRWLLGLAGAVPLMAGMTAGAATATAGASSAPVQAASAAQPCGTLATPAGYTHVIWIWMENHSFGDIIGSAQAPYINSLATGCGLATNYHNITHPSLPNYIAATSGLGLSSLKPFHNDCDPSKRCVTAAPSIFGQGETWRAYEESMPANCDPASSGEYATKHNPPPYYTSLADCSANDVPYSQLAGDLAGGDLPAFSFITPNLIDDMHDGTIADGDSWLASNLPAILSSPEYQDGSTVVFLTWDEGSGGKTGEDCAANTTDTSCQVATVVISPSTVAGTTSATLFNHYSLLGTAEELLGLPKLGLASSYPAMTSAFNL